MNNPAIVEGKGKRKINDERDQELATELKAGLINLLNKGEKLLIVSAINNFMKENKISFDNKDKFINFYIDVFVKKCQDINEEIIDEYLDTWIHENDLSMDKQKFMTLVMSLPLIINF